MTQNEIINRLKTLQIEDVKDFYFKSKKQLSSLEIGEQFNKTPGFSKPLYKVTKTWFDQNIIVTVNKGLNLQGYMRLIVSAVQYFNHKNP